MSDIPSTTDLQTTHTVLMKMRANYTTIASAYETPPKVRGFAERRVKALDQIIDEIEDRYATHQAFDAKLPNLEGGE